MLNFTVGPVQSNETVLHIGSQQVPYFRTAEFSAVMLENERLMKQFAHASESSRVAFITGSGTASMEAVVMNTLGKEDKVLVVNGGSFGQRFVELCQLHALNFDQIKLPYGHSLTAEDLKPYEGQGYTAFLVNVHETSTGVHYNMSLISDFCKRNGCFLVVDAISSFLADEFYMAELGVGVMITGSQKALACPPGISIIVLAEDALQRVESHRCPCLYLDLKSALKNGERGQTPFTPAVGTLLQIHARLKEIEAKGGVEKEVAQVAALAADFREKIKSLPFDIFPDCCSNAVTALKPHSGSAYDIFLTLKDHYGIWICPNGGELKDLIFRVGHIGHLTTEDNTTLFRALEKVVAVQNH